MILSYKNTFTLYTMYIKPVSPTPILIPPNMVTLLVYCRILLLLSYSINMYDFIYLYKL